MKIRFKVSKTVYQITGGSGDVTLSKVTVVKDKESPNYGDETLTFVGYHKDIFAALKSIPNVEVLSSECNTFKEVETLYRDVIRDLNKIRDEFILKEK